MLVVNLVLFHPERDKPMQDAVMTQQEQAQWLRFATYASVSVALILISLKLWGYWQTQSMAILASLIDSLLDASASVANLLAVRFALAPADASHRFGHGKAEAIAGLGQGVLIIGSAVFLVFESVGRLLEPRPLQAFETGLAVMLFTLVLTGLLVLFQSWVIARTQSAAIRADSLHYRTDLLTNLAVVGALLLSQLGWLGVDPVFALSVAAYTVYAAWQIIGDSADELLDRELPEAQRQQVLAAVSQHVEVRGVHDMRTRRSGRVDFVELHIELDDHLPLTEAHTISDEVEALITAAMPNADVMIHQDPVGVLEDQLDDKIAEAERADGGTQQ
jgi:ferrous-iron efflux pump FieF